MNLVKSEDRSITLRVSTGVARLVRLRIDCRKNPSTKPLTIKLLPGMLRKIDRRRWRPVQRRRNRDRSSHILLCTTVQLYYMIPFRQARKQLFDREGGSGGRVFHGTMTIPNARAGACRGVIHAAAEAVSSSQHCCYQPLLCFRGGGMTDDSREGKTKLGDNSSTRIDYSPVMHSTTHAKTSVWRKSAPKSGVIRR